MSKFNKKLRKSYINSYGEDNHYEEFAAKAGLKSSKPLRQKYHNPYKRLGKGLLITAAASFVVISIPATAFLIAGFSTVNHFNLSNRYSGIEIEEAKKRAINNIQSLNTIHYPSSRQSVNIKGGEEYINNMDRFAEKLLPSLAKQGSFVSSSLGLYGNLHLASMGISDPNLIASMNDLLGGDEDFRNASMKDLFMNNFFKDQASSVHASQAVFFDTDFPANPAYLDNITAAGAEAYSCDFSSKSAQNGIINWVSNAVGEQGYLNANDLFDPQLDTDQMSILMLSALQFDVRWNSVFKDTANVMMPFKRSDGSSFDTTYMIHSFYGALEDRGDYVTFEDYYCRGYTIQYFVPKSEEDDLMDVLPASNFLSSPAHVKENMFMIRLFLPKFETKSKTDYTSMLKSLGLEQLYNPHSNVMKRAYQNGDSLTFSNLAYTKECANISFKEDGTTAKSIAWTLGMAGAAAPNRDGYDVKLNQRFAYVIRDQHRVPLFIGSYNG